MESLQLARELSVGNIAAASWGLVLIGFFEFAYGIVADTMESSSKEALHELLP